MTWVSLVFMGQNEFVAATFGADMGLQIWGWSGGDQPDGAGRGSMVVNLLLLVLWFEWCGALMSVFNQ
ncbi:hypothetical protein ACOI9X_13465 [Pseudomonas sp. P2757]|uniref:hypothetical protein n=1 Tax=unclassified Pseudomonas TaxID=196821 RepID=UPI003B5A667E